MKNIIFLAFLLIAGLTFGQGNTDLGTSTTNLDYKGFRNTPKAQGVVLVKANGAVVDLSIELDSLIKLLTPSPNFVAKNGTSVAALDSLVFGFTSRHVSISIATLTSSDSIYVSPVSTFPANQTCIRIGGIDGLEKDVPWTKLYFKFGYTPKAGKAYRMEIR